MPKISLIIPVHNRRETTLACLRHLHRMGELGRYAAIVVDDGSTDGTAAAVQADFRGVEVLSGNGHLWWTGAVALGMRHAFAAGADAVCWLNDDCLPAPGTLDGIVADALRSPQGLVAPACFNADTGDPVPNAFVGRTRVACAPGENRIAEGLSGFCVAVPRVVWTRLGPPDCRHFPHYFGDNAYTLCASRAGFPCRVLGSFRAELTAFHLPPDLPALRDPALGWRENFHRVLVSPKSPYRLGTLWAFQRLKYGRVAGSALALARAVGWIGRLSWECLGR